LIERKIPATFFLNPGFLDNKQIMHRCLASLLIEEKPNQKEQWLQYRYTSRDQLLELAQKEGVEVLEYLQSARPYLSISQAKELSKMGFSVGSHSIDHPEFPLVSEEEQVRQVRESQAMLEVMLDIDIPAFAFPFEDLNVDSSLFLLLSHHYMASFGTSGIKEDPRQSHFQRLDMEKAIYGGPELIEASYFYNWLR
jgi:peptidoglycan/xylan/chitin deacetylase (PgdA/CDA1 family)